MYARARARAMYERRTGISAVLLVRFPPRVGTGFKGGRHYIWLPGTAHLVYAPCLTQQGRKGPSYSQKRFLAEDLVCCQYHPREILSVLLSILFPPYPAGFGFLFKTGRATGIIHGLQRARSDRARTGNRGGIAVTESGPFKNVQIRVATCYVSLVPTKINSDLTDYRLDQEADRDM